MSRKLLLGAAVWFVMISQPATADYLAQWN